MLTIFSCTILSSLSCGSRTYVLHTRTERSVSLCWTYLPAQRLEKMNLLLRTNWKSYNTVLNLSAASLSSLSPSRAAPKMLSGKIACAILNKLVGTVNRHSLFSSDYVSRSWANWANSFFSLQWSARSGTKTSWNHCCVTSATDRIKKTRIVWQCYTL